MRPTELISNSLSDANDRGEYTTSQAVKRLVPLIGRSTVYARIGEGGWTVDELNWLARDPSMPSMLSRTIHQAAMHGSRYRVCDGEASADRDGDGKTDSADAAHGMLVVAEQGMHSAREALDKGKAKPTTAAAKRIWGDVNRMQAELDGLRALAEQHMGEEVPHFV